MNSREGTVGNFASVAGRKPNWAGEPTSVNYWGLPKSRKIATNTKNTSKRYSAIKSKWMFEMKEAAN